MLKPSDAFKLTAALLLLMQNTRFSNCSKFWEPETINGDETACEGEQLRLSCTKDRYLKIIRATYGRFSLKLCNKHQLIDYADTSCMWPGTAEVLKHRCDGFQHCSITANNRNFGDACPGTSKYLYVQFHCIRAPRNQERGFNTISTSTAIINSSPAHKEWIRPSEATTFADQSASEATVILATQNIDDRKSSVRLNNTLKKEMFLAGQANNNSTGLSKHFNLTMATSKNHSETAELISPITVMLTTLVPSLSAQAVPVNLEAEILELVCPQRLAAGILWPPTLAGTWCKRPCPNNSELYGQWFCERNQTWVQQPDMSRCALAPLNDSMLDEGSNEDLLDALNDTRLMVAEFAQMEESSSLTGSEMELLFRMLNNLTTEALEPSAKREREYTKITLRRFSATVMILQLADMLLSQNQTTSVWIELPRKQQLIYIKNLLSSVQKAAISAATSMLTTSSSSSKKSEAILLDHLEMQVKMCDSNNSMVSSFSDASTVELMYSVHGCSNTVVVFTQVKPTEQLLGYLGKDNPKNSAKLVSNLVSASVFGSQSIHKQPMSMSIAFNTTEVSTQKSGQRESLQCALFHVSSSNHEFPSWSIDNGCHLFAFNRRNITCFCDRVSAADYYGVLLATSVIDVKLQATQEDGEVILRYVTLITGPVSMVCLMLAILAFYVTTQLSCLLKTIQINLLLVQLIFTAGFNVHIHTTALCGIVAAVLLYTLLTSFCCMLLEAALLYALLLQKCDAKHSPRTKLAYAFAYGLPASVVLVSAIVNPEAYRTTYRHCWPNTEEQYFAFYSVNIPVLVVLFVNLILLFLSAVAIRQRRSSATPIAERCNVDEFWLLTKLSFVVTVSLSLSWCLCFMSFRNATLSFLGYGCITLNSMQGCLIFLVKVVLNKRIRRELQAMFERCSAPVLNLFCSSQISIRRLRPHFLTIRHFALPMASEARRQRSARASLQFLVAPSRSNSYTSEASQKPRHIATPLAEQNEQKFYSVLKAQRFYCSNSNRTSDSGYYSQRRDSSNSCSEQQLEEYTLGNITHQLVVLVPPPPFPPPPPPIWQNRGCHSNFQDNDYERNENVYSTPIIGAEVHRHGI